MSPRPITFLSDYGHEDEFAGVCRAVIARIAPATPVIDVTHGVRRHAIAEGAAILARALPYAEPGVHLAVVDPGVGGERRCVAVRAAEEDRVLVGPDNGLLAAALERFGGPAEAADVSRTRVRLEPLSATFHGRDIFAPVAAHLSLSEPLHALGEPIDPGSLAGSPLRSPQVVSQGMLAHAVLIDTYGNVSLDVPHERLPETGLRMGRGVEVVAAGGRHTASYSQTFADAPAGALVLYEDSYRHLALAVNRGNAAELLGIGPGAEVVLRAV